MSSLSTYLKFHIRHHHDEEMVVAQLLLIGFESFDTTSGLYAFIPKEEYTTQVKETFEEWAEEQAIQWDRQEILPTNWNAVWESQFDPIVIDEFCVIRASFHEPLGGVSYDILIDPKMSFGTGHHETTRLMIQQIRSLDIAGARVLDFGAGTGVLAILAEKMQAEHVVAIEIEPMACENIVENVWRNDCRRIDVREGSIDCLNPDERFDIILANITRNVLIATVDDMKSALNEGGKLIVSGIRHQDRDLIVSTYIKKGFQIVLDMEDNQWHCLRFEKS